MQERFLLYLESIRTPLSAGAFEAVTILGEVTFAILAITFVVWCIDKRKGTELALSVLISVLFGFLLKAVIRYPRPFFVLEQLNPVRVHTATGYSFPSGHTLNVAALWTSLSLLFRKKWLYIVNGVVVVLVGISRMVLGAHWPTDVIGGIVIGVVVPVILIPLLERKSSLERLEVTLGSLFIVWGLVSLAAILGGGDAIAFEDIVKLALFGGAAMVGLALEERKVGFVNGGGWKASALRCAVGDLVLVLITVGIKKMFGTTVVVSAIRYTLCGIWVTYLYPLTGAHFGLFIIPPASTQPSQS